MKIINDSKINATYVYQIARGKVFTLDGFVFYIKVSDYEPIGFGVETESLHDLFDQLENNFLGVDLETGEVASFARNTVVIPVPNFVGRVENEVSNV